MTYFPRALRLLLAASLLAPAWSFAALPIQHWVQAGGARIYLVESRVLPMVDVQLDFDGGTRRDPPGKPALANFTANLAEKGLAPRDPRRGTQQPPAPYDRAMDENQLGEAWADLGASFDADASNDRLSFFLRSLTDPELLARAVALAARQIGEPAFPADLWERDRARIAASLRESLNRPATIAGRAFMPAVFGNHPYGGEATEASLAAVSVADMQAFYARHVQACQARITIVGAVSREQADRLAQTLLSRLPAPGEPGACVTPPAVPDTAPLAAPLQRDIPFASAQAHVLMGQPGYKRSDPAVFPLLVGNYILGAGGFVSRLATEVREKRGLSYSVYSSFTPGLHTGAFFVGLQTRPDQAQQAVQVAREVVARFVAEGPTAAELQAAKDNLIGGFALRIDSNRKLLDNVSAMAWYDLPLDYLDTWSRQVRAVTLEEVRAAFQRVLQPERMVTVIVGGAPAPAPAR